MSEEAIVAATLQRRAPTRAPPTLKWHPRATARSAGASPPCYGPMESRALSVARPTPDPPCPVRPSIIPDPGGSSWGPAGRPRPPGGTRIPANEVLAPTISERELPVRRRLALKDIKPDQDDDPLTTRFESERKALAMMNHPSIARVFDAGVTDTGRPYLVTELVKGVPITEYCDTMHLAIEERLELFIPVCEAIAHAHQKGIIHRDLKPSNVLVTLQDDEPVPKIIDFGLATAVEPLPR